MTLPVARSSPSPMFWPLLALTLLQIANLWFALLVLGTLDGAMQSNVVYTVVTGLYAWTAYGRGLPLVGVRTNAWIHARSNHIFATLVVLLFATLGFQVGGLAVYLSLVGALLALLCIVPERDD